MAKFRNSDNTDYRLIDHCLLRCSETFVKRRDFIKQSLSASAVIVGTGYASFDMLGHVRGQYIPPLEQRAAKAAAKVIAENGPDHDEGTLVSAQAEPIPDVHPRDLVNARPAQSYQQLRAEQLMAKIPEPVQVEEIAQPELTQLAEAKVEIAKPSASAQTVQEKVANFETDFTDDVLLKENEYAMLVKTLERINKVQDYVGYGNFNVLSFDEGMKYARYSPRIGHFTKDELNFLDMLFHYNSSHLGFFGEKVISTQSNVIANNAVTKMAGTGHYLFRGYSEAFYSKIRGEVGDSLILTSGVRNVFKQYQLFMAKTVQASGNLSRASRSLAPPGHSYHAIGDFDVGQVGGGLQNFTAAFAETDEFKRLQDLGYVRIRYTADNNLGVRYEPWHIRVV
ncbi:MAG: M15 family metallopeptidase [Reinekea sp.]